jgi:hypothetical protein
VKVYFVATYDSFIKPIVSELAKMGVDCVVDNSFNKDTALESDVIWCDWADMNAFDVQNLPFRGKKILRIHAFEVYNEETYHHINPNAFDTVVFVSTAKKEYYEQRLGKPLANAVVLPNYVDIDKFAIPEGKQANNNVAVIGSISRKKGIGELLLIAGCFPDHTFNLIGEHQEEDVFEYFSNNIPKNVIYHEAVENDKLPELLKEQTYVLNTSLRESFGVSMYEAMACGLKPIVHNWVGAEEWYREDWLWKSIYDIDMILSSDVTPKEYREWAIEKANPKTLIDSVMQIISQPKQEKAWDSLTVAIVKTREEYLPKLMQTLKLQSCLSHYSFNVHVFDNMKKKHSIGEAFNMLADACKTDLILYVGDDDWLDECYIENCMKHYELRKEMYPQPIGIVTSCLFIENETSESYPCTKMPTGFWNAEYVRGRRFNELLPQQVDSEFVDRVREAQKAGEPTVLLQVETEYGYYYRQHGNNVSGYKITDAVKNGEGVKDAVK